MESLGYTLLMLLHGKLPWQGIKAKTRKEKLKRMYKLKKRTFHIIPSDLPPIILEYLTYTRNLKFNEKPKYKYFRHAIREVSQHLKCHPAPTISLAPATYRATSIDDNHDDGDTTVTDADTQQQQPHSMLSLNTTHATEVVGQRSTDSGQMSTR